MNAFRWSWICVEGGNVRKQLYCIHVCRCRSVCGIIWYGFMVSYYRYVWMYCTYKNVCVVVVIHQWSWCFCVWPGCLGSFVYPRNPPTLMKRSLYFGFIIRVTQNWLHLPQKPLFQQQQILTQVSVLIEFVFAIKRHPQGVVFLSCITDSFGWI